MNPSIVNKVVMHAMLSIAAVLVVLQASTQLRGQETIHSDSQPSTGDTPRTVQPFAPEGKLILIGGGRVTKEIRELIAVSGKAGQPQSCLVIIPTSSISAEEEPKEYWTEPWLEFGFESIEILHTRDRNKANTDLFNEPLKRATAVWVPGGDQNRFAEVYAGCKTEAMLQGVLTRGGVVSGTSAGAAMASKIMIGGGDQEPDMTTGLDLLPYAIVDQHFANRNRMNRLQRAVSQHPECVGLGIDESTAVVFHQSSMQVVGEGQAHLVFPPVENAEAKTQALSPGSENLNWTDLVRQSRERVRSPSLPTARDKQ